MSSHDEANDASTLSIPDRVFISAGCFSLDISGRRLSSLKNVEWGGGGGMAGWTHMSGLSGFIYCLSPPPSPQIQMFFFHAWLAFHSVCHWCCQDSPHHLSTLHFTCFFIWFISLSVASFLCFLPLLCGLSCSLSSAGGRETSSNQCVEWISFEDSFKGSV